MDSVLADSTAPGERSAVFAYQITLRQIGSIAGPIVTISLFYFIGNAWDVSICRIVILCGLALNIGAMLVLFRLTPGDRAIHGGYHTNDGQRPYQFGASTGA